MNIIQSLPGTSKVTILKDLRIELLKACSLRCSHCSAFAAPHHPIALSALRVLSLMDEFKAMGGERLTLTGGEPFQYPDLDRVVERAHALQLRLRLFSSGVVETAGTLQSIARHRLQTMLQPSDTVVFSVYSTQSQIHDHITRTPGSLEMTLQTLRRARSLGIQAELHFVPTRLNFHELPALAELALAERLARISVLRFVPHGRGIQNAAGLMLTTADYLHFIAMVSKLRQQFPELELVLGSAHQLLDPEGCGPCTAALDQLLVESDGRVSPCSGFGNFRPGDDAENVLETPLSEVWDRSTFLNTVRQAHQSAPGCTGCLAQKAINSGRIDPRDLDPLEECGGLGTAI
jgi:radical SAM protein with 4Fe4S-binding SPASM domain